MNIYIAGTIDVSTLPTLPQSPDQIVQDVEQTLSEIRRIGDQLNDISKEGLEGVVRSLLLLILSGGLADYGLDLGINLPLSALTGLKGELVDWLIETTTPWLDGVFEDVKDTLTAANIPVDTATLQQAYK